MLLITSIVGYPGDIYQSLLSVYDSPHPQFLISSLALLGLARVCNSSKNTQQETQGTWACVTLFPPFY
jgi:hypothetical protein